MTTLEKLIRIQVRMNQQANIAVSNALKTLSTEELTATRGAHKHYKSLIDLYRHLLMGNHFCFVDFAKVMPNASFTVKEFTFEDAAKFESVVDFDTIDKALLQSDSEMVAAIESDISVVETDIHFFHHTKLALEISGWWGHACHHRGQISRILDEMDVENNVFGNIVDYTTEDFKINGMEIFYNV